MSKQEFREYLGRENKDVLIDLVCDFKNYAEFFEKKSKMLEKAIDILAFNIVCTIAGLKTKEEKREKKEEYKKMALEVAEFLVDEDRELLEVK